MESTVVIAGGKGIVGYGSASSLEDPPVSTGTHPPSHQWSGPSHDSTEDKPQVYMSEPVKGRNDDNLAQIGSSSPPDTNSD